MRRIAWDGSFRRAYRRSTRNNPRMQERIIEVLERLVHNPFDPVLRTHKLRGRLEGLWACWVQHDCRIVFSFEPDADGRQEDLIVLIDIGSHDEVY